MLLERFDPLPSLEGLVKEFWIYENDDPTPSIQKIIPDGFSEIIIHYGDPYEINLTGEWETQAKWLFSSQISRFFFLRNSGQSGMIGIKLYPHAFYSFFGVDLSANTDHVVPINDLLPDHQNALSLAEAPGLSTKSRVNLLQNWLARINENGLRETKNIDIIIQSIFDRKGMIDISTLSEKVPIGPRQLERLFKKVVGITPKFFSRIIRFNHIFDLIKEENTEWVRIALSSGYFDQSHFIKEFKEFTGEEPSVYGFNEENLANFFLIK